MHVFQFETPISKCFVKLDFYSLFLFFPTLYSFFFSYLILSIIRIMVYFSCENTLPPFLHFSQELSIRADLTKDSASVHVVMFLPLSSTDFCFSWKRFSACWSLALG